MTLAEGQPVRVLSDRWSLGPGEGEVSRIVPEGVLLPAGTVMVRFPQNPEGHYPYPPEEVEPRVSPSDTITALELVPGGGVRSVKIPRPPSYPTRAQSLDPRFNAKAMLAWHASMELR